MCMTCSVGPTGKGGRTELSIREIDVECSVRLTRCQSAKGGGTGCPRISGWARWGGGTTMIEVGGRRGGTRPPPSWLVKEGPNPRGPEGDALGMHDDNNPPLMEIQRPCRVLSRPNRSPTPDPPPQKKNWSKLETHPPPPLTKSFARKQAEKCRLVPV